MSKYIDSQILSLWMRLEKRLTMSTYIQHIKNPKCEHFGFAWIFSLYFLTTLLNIAIRFINEGNVSSLRD